MFLSGPGNLYCGSSGKYLMAFCSIMDNVEWKTCWIDCSLEMVVLRRHEIFQGWICTYWWKNCRQLVSAFYIYIRLRNIFQNCLKWIYIHLSNQLYKGDDFVSISVNSQLASILGTKPQPLPCLNNRQHKFWRRVCACGTFNCDLLMVYTLLYWLFIECTMP